MSEPAKTDRVLLTGKTAADLRKGRWRRDFQDAPMCYLCKRHDGDPAIALRIPGEQSRPRLEPVAGQENLLRITAADEEPSFVEATLQVGWVTVHRQQGTDFLAPLCQECAMVLGLDGRGGLGQ